MDVEDKTKENEYRLSAMRVISEATDLYVPCGVGERPFKIPFPKQPRPEEILPLEAVEFPKHKY